MALLTPCFAQDQAYPFSALRLLASAQASPGVVNPGDMLVSPASGLQVSIAPGKGFVQQTVSTEGGGGGFYNGLYAIFNDAPASPNTGVLAPTVSPRVDQVIARIYDVAEQGLPGSSFARFEWVQGSETPGANVTPGSSGFLAGIAAVPTNSLVLAYVLQTVGETSNSSGNVLNVAPVQGQTPWTPITPESYMQTGYPGTGADPAMVRVNRGSVEMMGYLSAPGAVGSGTPLATFAAEFSPFPTTGNVFSEVIPFNWDGGTTLLIVNPGSPCSLWISTSLSPGEQICLNGVSYRQGL